MLAEICADDGLLVACSDGAPLLEASPVPINKVAIVVGPIPASELLLVALGRDRRPCAARPDVVAKAVAGIATVIRHPLGHAGQPVDERNGVGLVHVPARRNAEDDGAPASAGDHTAFYCKSAIRMPQNIESSQ